MPKMPFDIVAYTYKAENLCADCLVKRMHGQPHTWYSAENFLDTLADLFGINREDETTFDSDDFPKVVFRDQLVYGEGEDDPSYADRCECCARCGLDLSEV